MTGPSLVSSDEVGTDERQQRETQGDFMSKTTSTRYSIGDKVKVKFDKAHNGMGKDETGTIVEISTPALGVKFPSMPQIHKWYADEEVYPSLD